jgi:NlpC/P60 family/Bacterial dipeptidyl-peptidase Sh3 domain
MLGIGSVNQDLEFVSTNDLNIYDSVEYDRLGTQAIAGRHFNLLSGIRSQKKKSSTYIKMCDDGYTGWISYEDLFTVNKAPIKYKSKYFNRAYIEQQLFGVIEFCYQAMECDNHYLWGGTLGPNFDCSGLIQTAYLSKEIQLPRNAWQQELFVKRIPVNQIDIGDLLFFGALEKAIHVGIYVGQAKYIHCSGIKNGRNGISLDTLSNIGDETSKFYFSTLRGVGRVMSSYLPLR